MSPLKRATESVSHQQFACVLLILGLRRWPTRDVVARRLVAVVLILFLLAGSAPAAPKTIVEVVQSQRAKMSFWLRSNDVLPRLVQLVMGQERTGTEQEQQAQRDARVSSIEIWPGDVTVREGQQVNFTALAYDHQGNQVGGVRFIWTARDEDRSRAKYINKRGDFNARATGNFTVIAEGAGRRAMARVTVIEGLRKHRGEDKPLDVKIKSSRDLPNEPVQEALNKKAEGHKSKRVYSKTSNVSLPNASRATYAHSNRGLKTGRLEASLRPTPYFLDDGWGNDNYWSADDPGNRRGNPPGTPLDNGAGSGNFQFALPVLSLAGRGINISLGLSYNSRVWNKAGNNINFDIDRDWPAPGWNIGFGRMAGLGVYNGAMLIDGDGTRHSYTGTVTAYSWGTNFVGHTTDGTFIDYSYTSGTGGVMLYGQATLANGTRIDYNVNGPAGLYPTRITDPNGNYITITYVNNAGPRIQTVTDTLGRNVTFHYDSSNRLTAITAPGLGSGTRTLVRLHYSQLALNYSFANPLNAITRESAPWMIDAIYLPGTSTGYWFSQSDNSYSSYGMIKKVSERRGMTFTGADPVPPGQGATDQGTITAGQITREEVYNYPLNPGDASGTQASNLTDAPTYTSCTESWTRDGSSTMDQAVTTYESFPNANPRTVSMTLPNGTTTKQYSHNSPGTALDGLVYLDETKSGMTVLQSTSTTWQAGAYNSPRSTEILVTNQIGQTVKTTISYGASYNQVTEVKTYDFNSSVNLLKATRTQYQNSINYTSRHIFSLPLTVEVFASDNTTRVSRTDYQYDGQTLTDTPGVIMHDDAWNPYYEAVWIEGDCYLDCTNTPIGEPCDWVCDPGYWYSAYDSATTYRGNVTQVTSYADAINLTGSVTETRGYDRTGNLVTTSSSCCQQISYGYDLSTYYGYPLTKKKGSATDVLKQLTTSISYDFNTGLTLSSTDVNGRTTQTVYEAVTLRPQTITSPGGGHKDFLYNDSGLSITETTYLQSHPTHTTIAQQNVRLVNGRGQVRQAKALGEGGIWDLADTVYTPVGDISQESRPYHSGDTIRWTTSTYDALGRVTVVTAPDASTTQFFYNESNRPSVASNAPGQTVRIVDAWGRERWARNDAQGRLVEVVEPDPNGSGSVATNGMVTTYGYDTIGNLISVTQGAQTRSFKHDSLGRLVAQKLAEKTATLNNSGTYVGVGGSGAQWSDYFRYDARSNLVQHRDARGVKINFWFFDRTGHTDPGDGTTSDPLNRLQSVTYDTTGDPNYSLATNHPNYYLKVLDAPTVTYQYRTKSSGSDLKDITQLAAVITDGISTESFHYDTLGRVDIKTLVLNSRTSYPFVTEYSYDTLDRNADVTYPAEYGNGTSAPRRIVHRNFDIASRVSSLTVGGQAHASNIVYNATSQTTSLKVGAVGTNQITESYSYDDLTGLVQSQTVTRNGSTLMNLSYEYTNSNGKRSGQLTKLLNNLDHSKDRGYEYDAVGRLKRATGGQTVNWVQRYAYDRYGNRTHALSYTAEQYVRNFYQSALNRQPTTNELQTHLSTLQAAYAQGPSQFLTAMRALGTSIFTSAEYNEPDNREFVRDLYRAFLYREPDQAGEDYWTSMVPINGRNNVRLAFELCEEFSNKVNGISPNAHPSGSSVPKDGWEWLNFEPSTNRISDAGWTYDSAGNQTRVRVGTSNWQVFQYDAANRIVRVLADDKVTLLAGYTYGSDRRRLISNEPSQAGGQGLRTYYATEVGSVAAEYTESGNSTTPVFSRSYVYLGARLLSTLTPNGSGGALINHHHPDRLGTRLVTNAQNTNSFEQVTLPFGTGWTQESGNFTNRPFTSYDRSPSTGLDYASNRLYDSQQGRFTQVDPIGIQAASLSEPQTLNLYSYCANDAINNLDPDGLFFGKLFKWVGKILKFLSLVALVVTAVIVFAPASSFIFKAVLSMLYHTVLALSQIPIVGELIPMRTTGSSQWDPRTGGINGWQDAATDGQCGQTNGQFDDWCTIFAKYSRFERYLRRASNFVTGVVDEVVPGMRAGRHLANRLGQSVFGFSNESINEDSTSYVAGEWTGFALTVLIPGVAPEKAAGTALTKAVDLSVHAVERSAERGISEAMIKVAIRRGEMFWDPANKSIVYVIRRGFVSGQDLLVATDPFTGAVKTVIRGKNLVRPRFVPQP